MNNQQSEMQKINVNVSYVSMVNSIETPTQESSIAYNTSNTSNLSNSSNTESLTKENYPTSFNIYQQQQHSDIYDATQSMKLRGYMVSPKPLTKTLQGSIWKGKTGNCFGQNIVIKVTNKKLHESQSTVLDGKKVYIAENIISEMRILQYLTNNGLHFGLTKYMTNFVDFFNDEYNYFLVMQDGGSSLFSFVHKAHQFILHGALSIIEWQNCCKLIFHQMLTFAHILHTHLNVSHLDISLENVLIHNISIIHGDHNQIHFLPTFNIKVCDFGLAQVFDIKLNPNFQSNKFVGKTNYKSPEIYKHESNFDARAADVWSLGVCLFAQIMGSMPFFKPSETDECFAWIISGHIFELIQQWNKLKYINQHQLDILFKIFQPETKRIDTKQLLSHSWFK